MNQEDFILHKYGTPEMDFAIWNDLIRYRLGSLSEDGESLSASNEQR